MKTQAITRLSRYLFACVIVLLVTIDLFPQQVIKFKNGHEYTVNIIYQTQDTLKYELISETGVIRSVLMDQVEGIRKDTSIMHLRKIDSLTQQQSNPQISDSIRFDNISRTLKAATTMCAISFLYQAAGAGLLTGAALSSSGTSESASAAGACIFSGLIAGIGGIGMATNIPILTTRAYKQVLTWNCNPQDIMFKDKLRKDLYAAKTIGIIQNFMPVMGLATVFLSSAISHTGKANATGLIICIGIGALLTIPEVVLIEDARHTIKEYNSNLNLGTTKNGIGLIYKF